MAWIVNIWVLTFLIILEWINSNNITGDLIRFVGNFRNADFYTKTSLTFIYTAIFL